MIDATKWLNMIEHICEDHRDECLRCLRSHGKRFVTDQELLTTAIAKGELAAEAIKLLGELRNQVWNGDDLDISPINTFLDLPAVAKIIEEQKEGGKG